MNTLRRAYLVTMLATATMPLAMTLAVALTVPQARVTHAAEAELEEIEDIAATSAAATKPAAAPLGTAAATGTGEAKIIERAGPVEVEVTETNVALETVAYLHPAVVHMPIAWVILLLLLEAYGFVTNDAKSAPFARALAWLAFLSFIPGLMTGFAKGTLEESHLDAEDLAEMLTHRNMMLVSAALMLVLAVLRSRKRNSVFDGGSRLVYLGLLLALFGILSLGAHIGGEMVYGDGPWE